MIIFVACSENHIPGDETTYTLDEKIIFTNKPLKIVVNGQYQNFGPDVFGVKNKLFNILNEIGKEFEEKFGYTLDILS
jgi:hypothetical protein